MAEWLRRLTRNQIPSGSVGSNPTDCEAFCSFLIPNINMSLSNVKIVKLHSNLCASNVGSVVECSPATRAARVRFPDVAAITFFNLTSAFYFPTHKQIFYHKILVGDAGYRSPYLSHAKRALYHLSYIPCVGEDVINKNLLPLVSTLQSCAVTPTKNLCW